MNIKQTFDDALAETEELHRAHCQHCREMLARFVEQGGDAVTAASIRANWNPSWGEDPGPPASTQEEPARPNPGEREE